MIELNVVQPRTYRPDKWWVEPMSMALYFVFFTIYVIYVTLVAPLEDSIQEWKTSEAGVNYISPFFSPDLKHFFGIDTPILHIPGIGDWKLSPALLIIWAPLGFRATCYYGRKVIYRSFFWSPPACAVDGFKMRQGKYKGDGPGIFFIVHLHRYFFYLAFILAVFHWIDTVFAMQFRAADGSMAWGIGLGTILSAFDALFLTLYVISCHSFRHLMGGGANTPGTFRYWLWSKISKLNRFHGLWFWLSLFMIVIVDVYFRLVAMGIVTEMRWLF
ncbi:MAG: succinate dehydrogenase [Methanobacteriota archaeon]|nr:MAG: succinate dehydrogenase [Euryarchaeota archaeon]